MHYRRTATNLRREPRAERLITAAIGLLITLICTGAAAAQTGSSTIAGVVKDESGGGTGRGHKGC